MKKGGAYSFAALQFAAGWQVRTAALALLVWGQLQALHQILKLYEGSDRQMYNFENYVEMSQWNAWWMTVLAVLMGSLALRASLQQRGGGRSAVRKLPLHAGQRLWGGWLANFAWLALAWLVQAAVVLAGWKTYMTDLPGGMELQRMRLALLHGEWLRVWVPLLRPLQALVQALMLAVAAVWLLALERMMEKGANGKHAGWWLAAAGVLALFAAFGQLPRVAGLSNGLLWLLAGALAVLFGLSAWGYRHAVWYESEGDTV